MYDFLDFIGIILEILAYINHQNVLRGLTSDPFLVFSVKELEVLHRNACLLAPFSFLAPFLAGLRGTAKIYDFGNGK